MSVISNTSGGYPAVSLKNLGDAVVGRIIALEDYEVKEFGTENPKLNQKTQLPELGVRISLEMTPGDPSTRVTLWAEKWRMIKAIAVAVKGAGAADLEIGADLAVSHNTMDGRAKGFSASYGRPAAGEAPPWDEAA